MNTLPAGIYLETDKNLEFDFANRLLTISKQRTERRGGSVVSPFRIIRHDDKLFLLIHNYDRMGERRMLIESIDHNELVINHDNISYTLRKVA